MKIANVMGLGIALFSVGGIAQVPLTPLVPTAAVIPATSVLPSIAPEGQAILRTGTEVPLRLSEQLTTKNKAVRVGQRFRLAVAEDINVGGQIVIPAGSPAMGEITDVRNKGMWGKSGRIGARVLYVQVNGRQIRLTGSFDDKGKSGGWGAGLTSALVFLPAGFFMTGTSAVLPLGGMVKAFVDEDVPLSFAASTVTAPLVVAPTTSPMAVPVSSTTVPPR